jgi:hypothetical protein
LVRSPLENAAEELYLRQPIELLLELAAQGVLPWGRRPSFKLHWVRSAVRKARSIPGEHVDVRAPFWKIRRPVSLSFRMTEWTSEPPVQVFTICAASSSPAQLVADLALGLRALDSNRDELLKSLEVSERGKRGGFLHSISCIPGSRR